MAVHLQSPRDFTHVLPRCSVVACLQVESCVDLAARETWSAATDHAGQWSDRRVRGQQAARQRSARGRESRDRYRVRLSTDVGVSPLGRLVRQTRGRLGATRDLWRLLPEHVCDELTVTAFDNNSRCWNGRSYRCPSS